MEMTKLTYVSKQKKSDLQTSQPLCTPFKIVSSVYQCVEDRILNLFYIL